MTLTIMAHGNEDAMLKYASTTEFALEFNFERAVLATIRTSSDKTNIKTITVRFKPLLVCIQAMSQAQSAGPLTVTQESVDAAVRALEEDRRLAVAFLRSRWAPLETFMDDEGPLLMLELVQASPGERCDTSTLMF